MRTSGKKSRLYYAMPGCFKWFRNLIETFVSELTLRWRAELWQSTATCCLAIYNRWPQDTAQESSVFSARVFSLRKDAKDYFFIYLQTKERSLQIFQALFSFVYLVTNAEIKRVKSVMGYWAAWERFRLIRV